MYNIDLYKYWQDPYSSDKKFTIHPLNDEGKEKYYSDQSHCTHYLKRSDPFVFKSIVGVDYDTLVRQQKHDIAQLNSLKNTSNQNHIEENKINENETYQKIKDLTGTDDLTMIIKFVMLRNKRYNYNMHIVDEKQNKINKLKKEIKSLKSRLTKLKNEVIINENEKNNSKIETLLQEQNGLNNKDINMI